MSWTSTGTELRRFRRGLLPKLAVGAMIFVPLLYGAMYLWAFWDPTGNLDKLPVAIVNADTGTTIASEDGDETLNAGDEVATKLVDSGDLEWAQVDATTAEKGVKDGTYYFALTIPEGFSEGIASAAGDDPQAAQLMVTYNDANSFLATTLGRSAMTQVQGAVREEIGAQAVDKVLVGLGSARDGFAQASDGSLTLTTASGQLTDGATQVADGATTAADGAGTLASGIDQLADGAGSAVTGAGKLANGAGALSQGASSASAGASKLAAGASSAADGASALAAGAATTQSGMVQLADGAHQLATGFTAPTGLVAGADKAAAGAQQVSDGVTQVQGQVTSLAGSVPTLRALLQQNAAALGASTDPQAQALAAANKQALGQLPSDAELAQSAAGLQALADGSQQVAAGLPALSSGIKAASAGAAQIDAQLHPGAGTQTVRDGVDGVAAGAANLSSGLSTLRGGASDLAAGNASLASGAGTLATGTSSLYSGAQQLATGAQSAATGAGALAEGTRTLADGATQVADGGAQLTEGAQTLTDKLAEGSEAIPDDGTALREQRAEVIAAPVTVADTDLAEAEGFGEGFAPFFIPLALFVGALITWLLMRPLPSRALATPASGLRATLAGFLPALCIGFAQVAVMLAVIHWGVGLDMTHALGTLAFTTLVAATFLALQQALMALLGPAAGKVAILALLMLQLASSGGTYPVQTTPAFFQAIHPLLPMSYAVDGLRQTITGGVDGRLWFAVVYLGVLLLASLAISAWRAGRMRTWTLDRLHPALEI
ncbi:YhgE/Pip family protein [Oerskovia enterophila]